MKCRDRKIKAKKQKVVKSKVATSSAPRSHADTDAGMPAAVDDDEDVMSDESVAVRPIGRKKSKKDADLDTKYKGLLDGLDKMQSQGDEDFKKVLEKMDQAREIQLRQVEEDREQRERERDDALFRINLKDFEGDETALLYYKLNREEALERSRERSRKARLAREQ